MTKRKLGGALSLLCGLILVFFLIHQNINWSSYQNMTVEGCIGEGRQQKCPPSFIILGAGKSGTSSLFYYLSSHPQVIKPIKKQLAFFDHGFKKGLPYYLSLFPSGLFPNQISGESTPGYLVYASVAPRIAELLPNVRLLAVVRDPVERAWSAYQYHYARPLTLTLTTTLTLLTLTLIRGRLARAAFLLRRPIKWR